MSFFIIRLLMVLLLVLSFSMVPDSARSAWDVEPLWSEPIFDGQVRVREAGRGNPEILLLIHGLGNEASDIWTPFVAELAGRFHVIAPDLPGFGRSSRGNHLYSPDNYAGFVHWLMGRFPDKPIYLVGHSLGGAISLTVAARYGDRLERLVLIDSVGLLHRLAVSQHYVRDLIRLDLPLFSSTAQSGLGRMAGLILEKTSRVPLDPDLILATAATRQKFLGADPSRVAALALVQTDFTLLLPRIRVPTRMIWGELDAIAPPRIARILEWTLPGAQLHLLPQLGHTPMKEDPSGFIRLLLQVLNDEQESNPAATKPPLKERIATCDNEQGRSFRGDFAALILTNCRDVLIDEARIGRLELKDSQVILERSVIGSAEVDSGISLLRSHLTMTGVDIRGRVGIRTDQSRVDGAGVRFIETSTAVAGIGNPSSLLFSTSVNINQGQSSPLHLSRSLRDKDEF